MKKVNIITNSNNQLTSDQADMIAKAYWGLKTTDKESGLPFFEFDNSSSINGVKITMTKGIYEDTKLCFESRGCIVTTPKLYVRFLDSNVKDILISNNVDSDSDGYISTTEANHVTTISDWFKNYEGNDTSWLDKLPNVKSLGANAFLKCKRIIGRNITSIGAQLMYSGNITFDYIMLPSVVSVERTTFHKAKIKLVDVGVNLQDVAIEYRGTYTHIFGLEGDMRSSIIILRTNKVYERYGVNSTNYVPNIYYVQSGLVETYKGLDVWSSKTLLAIGGTEEGGWCDTMQSLASEEGFSLDTYNAEHGTSYDWSYEYIDYLIYGVEPPTE